jgi:exonuclease III
MIQDENLLGLDDLNNNEFKFNNLFNNLNDIGINNLEFDSPYENSFLNCAYYSEDEFLQCFKDSKLSSLLSLNIQGIGSKFSNFQEFLNNFKYSMFSFDILALQEIHNVHDKDSFFINGYHELIYKSRTSSNGGGGVAFYVSNVIKFKILEELSIFHDKIFESIFIEAELPDNTKIIVGNVYRSPSPVSNLTQNEQLESFIDIMSNVVSKLSDYDRKVYILGDFNIDLLQFKNHRKTHEFIDSMFASGYLQLINHPTRVAQHANSNSATLIDQIWTDNITDFYTSGIITTHISDHFAPFCFLNNSKSKDRPKYIKTRNFSDENINSFRNLLAQANFQETYNEQQDTQLSYDKLHDTFFTLYDVHFPERTIRFNKNIHKIEPWMSNGLLTSRRTKLKLFDKFTKKPCRENKENFTKYKNVYNKLLRAMKKMYYSKQLISNQGNLKKTWEIIKEACNKNRRGNFSPQSLNVNGQQITQSDQIAEHFNQHFTSITDSIRQTIPPTDRPPDSYIEELDSNFTFNFTTPQQITEIFNALQSKSSTDFTGLSTKLVKQILPYIVKPLAHVFNLSLKHGIVPSQFKIAKVTPVFKKGGNVESLNDYRSINLLLIFSKILEKLVSIQLKDYLYENDIIHPFQFGFMEGNSTIHPMIHMLNKISNAMNKNEYTIGIFCDLTKAFDMVPVDIMCNKLEKLGIRGSNLKWFRNYLTDRKQFVCIDSVRSTLRAITLGLPQGSILGPILFLIFINDLPKSTLLFILLFCDDTTLLASGPNLGELVTFVNTELQKISMWFRANKMSLHPLKTKFTIFHPSPHLIQWDNINICIDENDIDCLLPNPQLVKKLDYVNHESDIPAIKFLGVYFDPTLTFKFHIEQLNTKLSKALFVIKRCKNLLSSEAIRSLYYSTFHCHLIYGIIAYSCSYDYLINDIFKKQKKAIRCISNAKYNQHTGPLFKKWKILPFPVLIEYFRLNFMYLYVNGGLPKSFRNENYWILNQDRNMPYALRIQEDFYVPRFRLSLVSRLPLISLPKSWNNSNMTDNIKNKPTYALFKKHIKKHLIENINVNCNRLLCPSCHINL